MFRILLCLTLLVSCNSVDIEDCQPALNFGFNIAGTWETPSLNSTVVAGEVTFDRNGSGSTTSASVFDNGSLEFTWSYDESDSTLIIGDQRYEVVDVTCIEVSFVSSLFSFTITR